MIKKLGFLLLATTITLFVFSSCDTTNPSSNKKITLEVEDASCTEAWLNIKLENIYLPIEITIKQNDSTVIETNINSNDTTLFVESLLPNQTYSFQSTIQSINQSSNSVSVITIDTTSHNFTWETFTLGDVGTSYLKDIAIINENNIWAVGEIHTEDTDKFDSNGVWVKPYNAIHWNGFEWELERVNGYSSPIYSIFGFNENDIWFDGVLQWNGSKYILHFDNFPLEPNGDGWRRQAMWGTTNQDIFVVGNGGNIAHYDGSSWTKIESGTENRISDIWGVKNSKTAENEVYFTIAGSEEAISQITDISNVQVVEWRHTNAVESVWGLNDKLLFVAGEGIFRQNGNVWIKEELEKEVLVMDIKGDNYNNVVAVGLNGELNYFNGATWKTHNILDGNLGAVSVKNNIIATIGIYKNVIIIGKKN